MDTFLRVEKKYRMNEAQYKAFMERIKEHMNMDEYGKHTISNLYYDTPSRDMIRRSLDKPVFKEKLRLRAYGKVTDQDTVFVELKRKYDGMVYKRRCAMTNQDAMKFLNTGIKPQSRNLIFKEIEKCIERHPVEPSFMIAYDRIAMYGKEDNELRLTIDANLRSRTWDMDLTMGSHGIEHFDEPTYLMEIKLEKAIPLWLSKILNEEDIYPVSFSKYGAIYEKHYLTLWEDSGIAGNELLHTA